MTLSPYHQKYADYSDEEIQKRIQVKGEELEAIFSHIRPDISDGQAKVAIIGCGDKRFVEGHRRLFAEHIGKDITLTTFDIAVEHLAGAEGVVQHDCINPFPGAPFDVTLGHVVLRFIKPDDQWKLIKNSYDALSPGGVAIHVLDTIDYDEDAGEMPEGKHRVPLVTYKEKLEETGIEFIEVPIKYGIALVLKKT